jgi:hypothetical protein
MADIVENPETPVVEKEVEENDVPKVVEADEKAVKNGKEEIAVVPTENGSADPPAVPVVDDEDESKDGEEEKNGDSTDAPTTEAVKRKVVVSDSVDGVEEAAETPEKKSKLADENIATAEAEATA